MATKRTTKRATAEEHNTDLAGDAKVAVEHAAEEAERAREVTAEEASQRLTSQTQESGKDGAVEAVLVDAATKAEDTKRTDEARAAAELGNGFRVRQDVMEPVPPVDVYAGRRAFDVGGQPVYDPELAAKSSANYQKLVEKEQAKKG